MMSLILFLSLSTNLSHADDSKYCESFINHRTLVDIPYSQPGIAEIDKRGFESGGVEVPQLNCAKIIRKKPDFCTFVDFNHPGLVTKPYPLKDKSGKEHLRADYTIPPNTPRWFIGGKESIVAYPKDKNGVSIITVTLVGKDSLIENTTTESYQFRLDPNCKIASLTTNTEGHGSSPTVVVNRSLCSRLQAYADQYHQRHHGELKLGEFFSAGKDFPTDDMINKINLESGVTIAVGPTLQWPVYYDECKLLENDFAPDPHVKTTHLNLSEPWHDNNSSVNRAVSLPEKP